MAMGLFFYGTEKYFINNPLDKLILQMIINKFFLIIFISKSLALVLLTPNTIELLRAGFQKGKKNKNHGAVAKEASLHKSCC